MFHMQPGHRCLGKGQIHYIKVICDEDTDEESQGGVDSSLKLLEDKQHPRQAGCNELG